jgi:hypothetical protein
MLCVHVILLLNLWGRDYNAGPCSMYSKQERLITPCPKCRSVRVNIYEMQDNHDMQLLLG